jgi:hypothetical protein
MIWPSTVMLDPHDLDNEQQMMLDTAEEIGK